MFNKKALTSVVATSLIIVVTVFSIVAFQTSFSNYQNDLLNDVEKQEKVSLNANEGVSVETVNGETLYLLNKNSQNGTGCGSGEGASMCSGGDIQHSSAETGEDCGSSDGGEGGLAGGGGGDAGGGGAGGGYAGGGGGEAMPEVVVEEVVMMNEKQQEVEVQGLSTLHL